MKIELQTWILIFIIIIIIIISEHTLSQSKTCNWLGESNKAL